MRDFRLILTLLFSALTLCLSGQNLINGNAKIANDSIIHYHYDTLSNDKLEATYKLIDSLSKEEDKYLNTLNNIQNTLISGKIPVYVFNIKLNDIIDYNIGNGFMLGLGLESSNRLSKIFSVGGFGNYWFKAKEFNYGGDLTFNLLSSKEMKVKFGTYHKFERLGNYGFEENENILNPANFKYFYTNATSLNNSIYIDYSTYINKYLKGFIKFEVADKAYNRQQTSDNGQQIYRLSTIDFRLRIAFGETLTQSKDGLTVEGNANPVIWISYQKNLKNILGSPYNFDKAEFLFRGKKYTQHLGETSLTAQLGYINGFVPATELFNIYGTRENKFDIYCTESFSTMRPDEFFCDKFGALYISHNFKNLLIDFKKFHPEIILITNIAWINIIASQHLYCESGIVIDNIIRLGITRLGLATFYRYGSYSYDNFKENFVFKICLGFSL